MSVTNFLKGAFAATIILSGSAAFGQEQTSQQPGQQQQMPKRTPEQRAARQTDWMQKNLALTDDQNKKVYNIVLNGATAQENAQKGDRKDIMNKEMAALQQVLTADQFQKYQAHMQEMMEKNKERKTGME